MGHLGRCLTFPSNRFKQFKHDPMIEYKSSRKPKKAEKFKLSCNFPSSGSSKFTCSLNRPAVTRLKPAKSTKEKVTNVINSSKHLAHPDLLLTTLTSAFSSSFRLEAPDCCGEFIFLFLSFWAHF